MTFWRIGVFSRWKKRSMLPAAMPQASSGEEGLGEGAQAGVVRLDAGKVGGEHDVAGAEVMAQLDGHALDVRHAGGDVLADVVAGALGERFMLSSCAAQWRCRLYQ
jgi:hypothetical protein